MLKGEGEASAQATGEPPGDLSKQVDLQRTIGSWRTSRGPLKSRRAFGGPLRRGPPSSEEEAFRLVRRVSSGLIIDAAAAMDEGMETCSGDILGDEEEVTLFTKVKVD